MAPPAHLSKKFVILGAIAVVLLASAIVQAQDSNSYILATRRSGAIEIIDPTSLATISRIHFPIPSKSAGLNGVSASADGTILYVEGPTTDNPHGCCVLYSVDLTTLETKQVADIPGTASRTAFIASDDVVHPTATLTRSEPIKNMPRARLHISPDGRWAFGVVSFRGPALYVYDLGQNVTRELAPLGLEGDWRPTGIWSGDHFYFYAEKSDGSAARVWTVTPKSNELGEGVAVQSFARVPGCSSPLLAELAGAAENVFLYEVFGWKLDRRDSCSGVPGGAWMIDPSNGSLLAHVAQDSYFSQLVADHAKGKLYGISVGDASWSREVKLVRIDAVDGSTLQTRLLEADFWNIALAPLRNVPAADVRALTAVKK